MTVEIEFDNVTKRFRMERDRPRAFQDLFISLARRKKTDRDWFLALRDVSFQIKRGETVGLIGSNGAGKSTALKLISRIISPTCGNVTANSRVTALLELGAGFHPDLTGRDNIFLNGAVMGLSRKQIKSKLDEIIAFSEIEDFIDVPVKDYSSGMYARLGFSVAVHLDPEILLIDEVLAVGDQAFQQKCNERMTELRKSGVTMLFVSHSLEAVQQVCQRAIWLDHGRVQMDGAVRNVTREYHRALLERRFAHHDEADLKNRPGSGEARVLRVELLNKESVPNTMFATGDLLIVRMFYRAKRQIEKPQFGLAIHHAQTGAHMSGPNNTQWGYEIESIEGEGFVDFRIADLPLLAGDFDLTIAVWDWNGVHCYDHWEQARRFTVISNPLLQQYGLVNLKGEWEHSRLPTP